MVILKKRTNYINSISASDANNYPHAGLIGTLGKLEQGRLGPKDSTPRSSLLLIFEKMLIAKVTEHLVFLVK